MSAGEVQAFLRFLAQDAKVPLALAVSKVKELQAAGLGDVNALAKAKIDAVQAIFLDEKISKQVLSAAKRVSKKRAAGDESSSSPRKKGPDKSIFSLPKEQSADDLETSLQLPYSDASVEELMAIKVFSNRAPLVLAMTVMLLKYTMPEQPLSSRLSLAQGYVSTTSRSRAVSLGLETGKGADEEGFGEGQPITSIMGKELRVLKRWGYEAQLAAVKSEVTQTKHEAFKDEATQTKSEMPQSEEQLVVTSEAPAPPEEKPALWCLDLEALKKAANGDPSSRRVQSSSTFNMPIYTPQSARGYLLKSFMTPPVKDGAKKLNAMQIAKQNEENLGHLLRAIDLLYQSWLGYISPVDIEKRVWGWYVKARPAVESGVAGWGGKNVWRLADLLSSRRDTRGTLDAFIKKEEKDSS